MSKLGTSFTYIEHYLNTINELPEDMKYRVNWDLCFYGVYGELPEDASAMSTAIVKSFELLIQGSHNFQDKQKENGAKGGRPPKITDEQIKGAAMELLEKNEGLSSNKIGAMLGISGAAVRQRAVWKEIGQMSAQNKNDAVVEIEVAKKDPPATTSAFNF